MIDDSTPDPFSHLEIEVVLEEDPKELFISELESLIFNESVELEKLERITKV